MPIVRLGNKESIDRDRAGNRLDGNQVTTVTIHDEDPLEMRMRTITHEDGLWVRHSTGPAAWVESDDPELEAALAAHFDCPVGQPEGW